MNENSNLLNVLLSDHSTGGKIILATDVYGFVASSYTPESYLTAEICDVIIPRIEKAKIERSIRTRGRAEVFTPSWMCNIQNNFADERWFGRENVFNTPSEKRWKSRKKKIEFKDESGRTWKDYVLAERLEITCGEAPYLVSRYDTVTGEFIENVIDRIGLLDRKLRVVCENTDNEKDWFEWTVKAYQSTYGYEFQGDNLFLARKNLLLTFNDYLMYKFARQPSAEELSEIADIISWNIWQMDGLSFTVPYKEDVMCIIKDWKIGEIIEYRSIVMNENM